MSILNDLILESTSQFICSTPIRKLSKEDAISLYEENDDVTQNSLAEFEENEKRAAALENTTLTSSPSGVLKIESVLFELRECFKYDPNKTIEDEDATCKDFDLDQMGNNDTDSLESRLKHEMLRRAECERQVDELNKSLCEVRQQLSVAIDSEKKRQIFARKMDLSLNKVFPNVCSLKKVDINIS